MLPVRPLLILLAAIFTSNLFLTETQAQSAMPTTGILFRTVKVRSPKGVGTMFSIVVDSREYWITTKHVVTGKDDGAVEPAKISLEVLNPLGKEDRFEPYTFQIFDTEPDVDIVILIPATSIQKIGIGSVAVFSDDQGLQNGPSVGGECQFLGFPFALSWTAHMTENNADIKMPFTKHCYVTGWKQNPRAWVLDGLPNEGFSGGPVLMNTGGSQRIFAVISSYRNSPAELLTGEVEETQPTKSQTPPAKPKRRLYFMNGNSGLITAFSAHYAMEAIKRHSVVPIVTVYK
jgi:hypothetical protein